MARIHKSLAQSYICIAHCGYYLLADVPLQPSLYPLKKDCSLDNIAHQALKQEQTLAMQRLEENNMRLNRLRSTLMRIDNPNYGICEECEEEIPIERLKLIPESRLCIECINELN